MNKTRLSVLLACAALLAAAPRTLHAQDAARSSAYLLLRNNDTIAVEKVRRTATSVSAVISALGQPRVTLEYALGPDHLITRGVFAVFAPNAAAEAAPIQSGTVTMTGDSAIMEIDGAGGKRNFRVPVKPGTLPVVNNDFVVLEQAVRRARAAGVTTATVPIFALSAAQSVDARLELVGADSARFTIVSNVTVVALDAAGNVTGGGVPALGIRVVALTGAAADRITIVKPDYSAPAGAPYRAEEVTVRTPNGHLLSGTLTIPTGVTGRVPAVVTITGSGQQDRDEFVPIAGGYRLFRQVADTLGRRGIAVLRMDDRSIGGSGGDPEGTSADFADDIRAGVAYLRTRSEIDPDRIGLVGHSEGGTIAPMVAATDPKLAALVLLAGTAYTGRQIIDYQIENGVRGSSTVAKEKQDSVIKASKAQFDTTTGKQPWFRFFLEYDPIATARRVKQPTLILQGATDQQVRPEEARMLDRAMREGGNRRVTLRLFEARNHFFLQDPDGHPSKYIDLTSNRIDGEVMGAIADWLATTLRAR